MNLISEILSKTGRSKVVAGLEINLSNEGTNKLYLSILKRKRSLVEKVSYAGIDSYTLITKEIPSGIPINLVISGYGIITKKIAIEGTKNENEIIHKVLPNANEKDFYIQRIQVDKEHEFVSLVRKDFIDKILQELSELELEIISCSFGPFCMNNILPAVNPGPGTTLIHAGGYIIAAKEGKIDSIRVTNECPDDSTIKIGEEEIKNTYLLSYSSALAYFAEDNTYYSQIPQLIKASSDYTEKRIFSVLYKGILGLLLVLLMVNYFLFNHFFEKQNILVSELNTQKSSIEKYDTLKSLLLDKEDFLQKSGFLGEPKTSFYADQIAMIIPPEITLSEMNINPLKKNENPEDHGVSFSPGVINLLGICTNSIEFNGWVNSLKEFKWIKELKVLNYYHDAEGGQNRFSIEINIK